MDKIFVVYGRWTSETCDEGRFNIAFCTSYQEAVVKIDEYIKKEKIKTTNVDKVKNKWRNYTKFDVLYNMNCDELYIEEYELNKMI